MTPDTSVRDQFIGNLLYVDIKTSRPPTRILTLELFGSAAAATDSLIIAEDPEARYDAAVTDKLFTRLHGLRGALYVADPIESAHPEWQRITGFLSELPFIDLKLLVSVFFPQLATDTLSGFNRAFALESDQPIATQCRNLYGVTCNKLRSLPGAAQRQLRTIFRGLPGQYSEWIERVSALAATTAPEIAPEMLVSLDRFENLTSGEGIKPEELEDFFTGKSSRGEVVSEFEVRRGQSFYAQKVLTNLANGGVSLVEAATGTGKSIGYLLPLISVCHTHRERGIVVTRTKSLQEQLFRSDLTKIARLIPNGMQISILKGLGNYLCLLRYKVFISELAEQMGRYPAEALAALVVWEQDTKSGDLTETAIFEKGGADRLMFRVTVDEGSCLRRNCQFYSDCYGFRARKQAARSQVVITNYALLFSDLVSNADLLGKADHIIFDEAHRIQAEAVNAFSETVGLQALSRWLERISGEKFRSFLVSSLDVDDDSSFEVADFSNTAALLSDNVKILYQNIRDQLERRQREPGARVRFLPGDQLHAEITRVVHANEDAFNTVRSTLAELQQSSPGATDDSDLEGVTSFRRVASTIISHIETLVKIAVTEREASPEVSTSDELVFWALLGMNSDIYVTVAPVEVGQLLHSELYPRYHSLLFTSATLDSEDEFSWIKARLGLRRDSEYEAEQLKLPSPFPLRDQLRIVLARFLPPPNQPDYVKRLGRMLGRIVKQNPLPTLVLCTSYSMVERLADFMAADVEPANLLVQRSDVPAQALLNRFRRQKRGVLIGTESFWEGVDLPGDLLRLLVLTRMPFAVPDDPLEQARQERATQAGENAFMTVSIPSAVLKYRQGIGRMIRSAADWGVVVVSDSRMGHKRYGQIFIAASPVEVDIYDQEGELISAVNEWLSAHRSSSS